MESELSIFRRRAAAPTDGYFGDETPVNNDEFVPDASMAPNHSVGSASSGAEHRGLSGNNDDGRHGTGGLGNGDYIAKDGYTYEGLKGWRALRPLRPFRGYTLPQYSSYASQNTNFDRNRMYHDIRRRVPYYASDWIDSFTYRTVAATIRIYFVK